MKPNRDTSNAFEDVSEDLDTVLENSELEEFTEEELDVMNLGIAPEYARGWYKGHEDTVITTQGNVRKAFMEWLLENFTEFSDLKEVEEIAVDRLEDYNQVLVVNKRDKLRELQPSKEEETVAMYINKLAELRKKHQKEKDKWLRKKARLQEARDTGQKDTGILRKMIPVFVEHDLKVSLEDEEVERIKEIYKEVVGK